MKEKATRFFKYMETKGLNDNQVTLACGLSQGLLGQARLGKSDLGPKTVEKILKVYQDLNKVWLLTGEGDMLVLPNATPKNFPRHAGVPLVSQYAYAGYLSGFGDQEYIESLPIIDFTPDREMTGNYVAFEVRGDSMDDGTKHCYEQGEIVICREVEPYLYKESKLHFNQRDFVIVHEDGILLKRVIAHDVDKHTIVIHSLNPEYPDRTLDLSQVKQIFSIVESRMQRKR